MGFFSSTTHVEPVQKNDSVPLEEELIRRTIRIPSKSEEYQNKVFNEKFNKFEEPLEAKPVLDPSPESERVSKRARRFRFRDLFRRRAKVIDEQTTNPDSNKENFTPPMTYDYSDQIDEFNNADTTLDKTKVPPNNEFEIFHDGQDQDDLSSLQVSDFFETTPRRRRTFRGRSKKSNKPQPSVIEDHNHDISQNTIETQKSTRSFRERLFGSRSLIKLSYDQNSSKDSAAGLQSNPVYEAQETLTQRYMSNNYDKLIEELESIPFDLSVRDESMTIQHKLSQAVSALSPKKTYTPSDAERANSVRFKSRQQQDKCLEVDSWNPYETAKKVREIDAISLNSSDYELAEKHNVKIGKQRPSRLSTFIRKFSLRRSKDNGKSDIFESKPLNTSMDSVHYNGDNITPTLKLQISTNRKNQTLRNTRVPLAETFSIDEFRSSTPISKVSDFNDDNYTSPETVFTEQDFSKSSPTKIDLKPTTQRNSQFYSGSTNVDNSGEKNETTSLASDPQSISKEQGNSGKFSFYQHITANPIQFDVNNENIYRSISESYKSKRNKDSQNNNKSVDDSPSNKPKKSRSISSVDMRIPSKPQALKYNDDKARPKTNPKRPHTSADACVRNESNDHSSNGNQRITASQSIYSNDPSFSWNFSELRLQSEIEDEHAVEERKLREFEKLVRKNKLRHKEELKRPYSGV